MTDNDREDIKRRAREERRRRSEQNNFRGEDLFSGLMKGAGYLAAGAASAALLYRTGLGPAAERGLTFSSRFLSNLSAKTSSKAFEDWTVDEYRQLARGAQDAFRSARSEWGAVHIDPRDRRTLFGSLGDLREMIDSRGAEMAKRFHRQEDVINPAIDWYRASPVAKTHDDNMKLRIESFIRKIASHPTDPVAVYDAQKKIGAENDQHLRSVTDSIVQQVAKLNEDLASNRKNRRRAKVGARNILDVALNIENLEKTYGTARKKADGFFEGLIRGIKGRDRAATIRDILSGEMKIRTSDVHTYNKSGPTSHNPIDDIKELIEYAQKNKKRFGNDWYERFMDITPDASGIRISHTGEAYSTEGRRTFFDQLTSAAANTLPGKILKMRDIHYSRIAPQIYQWAKGSIDPALAAMTNRKENQGDHRVDSSLFRIYKDYYRMGSTGKLEKIGDLGGTHLYSGRHGATQHLMHQMSGDVRYKEQENAVLHWLDLFQDRDEFSGRGLGHLLKATLGKYDDPNYIGNVIDEMTDTSGKTAAKIIEADLLGDTEFAVQYLSRAKRLRQFMHETTTSIDRDTAKTLSEAVSEKTAQNVFEHLASDTPGELEDYLLRMDRGSIHNKRLSDLAARLRSAHGDASGRIEQTISPDRTSLGSSIFNIFGTTYNNETSTIEDIIRKELSKEALLREGRNGKPVEETIRSAGLPLRKQTETIRLAQYTQFEGLTAFEKKTDLVEEDLFNQVYSTHSALTKKTVEGANLRQSLQETKREQLNIQSVHYAEADEIGTPAEYNEWATMRDTTGPLDILSSLNSWTKFKATTKRFGRQMVAGRENMDEVSEYTLAPYFMLSRLSDEMNRLGVGFSKDNLGSTLDITKAIALKRILPIALASTYAEWMDDTSQEITGMSITGAAAQGIANTDLAMRKTLDLIGATDWLKGEKTINPIMQYWGDHNDFMSFDEKKKWYASGYEPVRKGAWWTFGGVNEARGGEITYWQPSFARRIQSDYLDKSLYDGYFDKWSHSLLPTPANPLSPIFGVLDPYWLEEKHKDDRPYMLTGEMFENGTPWGALLNSTIGALIKPQKSLHEIPILGIDYRNVNGVDPLALAHAINLEIKQKARDLGHRNYIQVDGDQYTPVSIDEYDAPTEDTRVQSVQIQNGQVVRNSVGSYGVYQPKTIAPGSGELSSEALASINESKHIGWGEAFDYRFLGGPLPIQGSFAAETGDGKIAVVNADGAPQEYARSLFTDERLEIDKMVNGDIAGIKQTAIELIQKYNPIKAINVINAGTKEKASSRPKVISPKEFDEEEGNLSALKLKSYRPVDAMNLLNDPETVADLVNAGKGSDAVRDAAISWRLVSGIYGYAMGAATGFGVDDKKIIATGQDMTSFSRTFWDSNIGGAGGSVMEIARRFIPDYRRGTRINPLMNEMPDWLPERFKFGDPFTLVPKGEMRLPGKGYEALNELHPDQFGRYGSFDRMKILADVAPFSPEYRMWRNIAKKTITDPRLVEEMDAIRERVAQQGKKHDFYDYNVVGRGLEYKNIVVSEVMDYGKFRSGNTIFKVAGASVKGNAAESMQDVLGRYIHVGQEVTVAVDENDASRKNNDTIGSISAAVFSGGENIGMEMVQNGDASIRKGDTSSAALLANYGPVQKGIGYLSEIFAHMDVPWLSDQFLRVRSPLESYKAEQVYGTPYQSWEHPISSFLMPALERSFHDRTAFTGMIGTAARFFGDKPGLTPGQNHAIKGAWLLSDRGAFIGAALSNLVKLGDGAHAMKWARHGSAIATAGHFLTGGNGFIDEVTSGANIGQEIAAILKKSRTKGALIGAAVGDIYRAAFGDNGDWIPSRTKKKWEMQDYFDRLTYIKYMGLFHQAAEKAKEEEDVDIEDIFERREKLAQQNRLASSYFKKLKKQLQRNAPQSEARDALISKLNERIGMLDTDKMVVPGGEWTRTAILYKQAADSTMAGLKKESTWSQIITALPTNDREYFMEFVKERDPDRREEILRYASPFLKKALLLAWGKSPQKELTNEQFFKKHELPKENWAGWAPQYDLKDIEVKTIENEGMMLADFGYYDSQLRDSKVHDAPTTNFSGTSRDHNIASVKRNLAAALHGSGLKNVDISVQPGPAGGVTSITAAIKHMLGIRTIQRQVDDSLSMQASL